MWAPRGPGKTSRVSIRRGTGSREPVWVGVDVGGDKSASAVAWINSAHNVGVEIYHGDPGVLDCIT